VLATTLMASALAAVTLTASPASAAVIPTTTLTIGGGGTVTVGDVLNASLKIKNDSTTNANKNEQVRIDGMSIVLSCGAANPTGVCPTVDPGVLTPSATAVGTAGTVCAGNTFSITLTDATEGRYSILPPGPLVTLGAATGTSALATCQVDFTVNVVKATTLDADVGTAGVQTTAAATVSATGLTSTNTGTSVSTLQKTVTKGTLTPVVTTVPASTTVGTAVTTTATLNPVAGAAAPTGTVRFRAFPAGNTTCNPASDRLFSRDRALNAAGTTADSNSYVPPGAGTYYIEAQYDGDANYKSFVTCVQATVVTKAATTTAVNVSPNSVGVGEPATAAAKVTVPSNGPNPAGTMTFVVYGPTDDTCSGTPTPAGSSAILPNGTATSDPFSTLVKGTYHFVATYSGDPNYLTSTSSCTANPAALDVKKATAPISVATSPGAITIGDSFNATATLTAPPGTPPAYTGNITFNVYGPGDTTCTGTPAFADVEVPVTLGGSAVSPAFSPAAPGTYRVIASYGPEASFTKVDTVCDAAGTTVDVSQAVPGITASVSPTTIAYGGTTTPSATLTGPSTLVAPTGVVTFSLYGPNDPTCADPTPTTTTGTVNASGVATGSPDFAPTGPGTYQVVAEYDGSDANYTGATSTCGDTPLVVTKATPNVIGIVAPPSVTLGGSSTPQVIVTPPAGTVPPTGTATFKIYGPGDTTCTTPLVTNTNVALVPTGPGISGVAPLFTPTAAGIYRVQVTYNGDSNFTAFTTGCDDTLLTVGQAAAPVSLTVVPNPGTAGDSIVGTATLAPPANTPPPTGNVEFSIYAPGVACTGTATATRTTALTGPGTSAVAGSFATTTAGTYHYIARYAGDPNFSATESACEAVVIAAGPLATLTITPDTSTVTVGDSVTYTATGVDAQGNSLGDVTAGTTFTSSPDGSVSGATVTFTVAGPHTVTGTYTATNKTDTATVTVNAVVTPPPPPPPGGPTITRLSGPDRYGTAVDASHKTFSPGVNAVFIASGLGFADGLAGGPGAAKLDGPVLLTPAGSLPTAVATEISRLNPKKIYILGGTASVSTAVETKLKTLGSVERLAGANRYATAGAIAGKLWSSSSTVYLASGAGFPDALSGGAAAADDNAPLLLTAPGSLSPETKAAIIKLNPSKIVIMGGTAAVTDAVKTTLAKQFLSADVSRIAGVDRYDTSGKALATTAGASSGKLVLASGAAFPDALSGVPVAAHLDAGFALTRATCLPSAVASALEKTVKEFFLMGGTSALSDSAATTVCSN
jgi:putative cell wall-binding protein